MNQTAYLVLANGYVFEGKSFGATGSITGEAVFTTGMCGYLETLTDPSYYGQIVMQTFPLIGNYGVIPADFESEKLHPKAYIVRDICQEPSNFRCSGKLDDLLKKHNIIGLYGIDTRRITKIIREAGVMNARIVSKEDATILKNDQKKADLLHQIQEYQIINAVKSVTCKETKTALPPVSKKTKRVVLWDFGAKANICRELIKRNCEVITVPSSADATQILSYKPHGIMLSNGPGDPAENTEIILELQKILKSNIPIFGICLGHQLLALAHGAKTKKLKYGHRGANQPVKHLETGRIYISSQNHGFTVCPETLPESAQISFINTNDNTNEGIRYSKNMFSVQFHPEAACGPLDTAFLFDDFTATL